RHRQSRHAAVGAAAVVATVGRPWQDAAMSERTETTELRVLPANEVTWQQLQTVFGQRGEAAFCQCQWFLARDAEFTRMPREEKEARLREQTACGHPGAATTSGIVAFL